MGDNPAANVYRVLREIALAEAETGDVKGALATVAGHGNNVWRSPVLADIALIQARKGDAAAALATAASIPDATLGARHTARSPHTRLDRAMPRPRSTGPPGSRLPRPGPSRSSASPKGSSHVSWRPPPRNTQAMTTLPSGIVSWYKAEDNADDAVGNNHGTARRDNVWSRRGRPSVSV